MILLDTNLLTRMTRSHEPQSGIARAAIQTLLQRRERLIVVPQNLYEFWAVATRPAGPPPAGRNGLGMTAVQAGHWLQFFRRRFAVLPDRAELSTLWQELFTRLLTFNASDFCNLGIVILDPAAV